MTSQERFLLFTTKVILFKTLFSQSSCWIGTESNDPHSLPQQTEMDVAYVQSCPTFCDSIDCNLPGSSVHRIFQAGILGWIATSSYFWPRDQTCFSCVSCMAGRFFTTELPRKLKWCRHNPSRLRMSLMHGFKHWHIALHLVSLSCWNRNVT